MAGTRVKIEFAQATDPGRDPNKQVNEDSCGYAETRFGHLVVLCDGMGGHYGGREASRTAIATIFEVIEQAPPHLTPGVALKASIEEAGRRVYRLGGPPENRARPGSTVVSMLLHDRGIDVAHVGDSRAYVIRQNQIYPLTRDHSMVQGMIDAGMLTEEQAIGHPDANKITRALGMKPEVDVELRPEPMELYPGDLVLQSSDGLTDLALGADILGATRQALASGPVQHACNMLVQLANNRGGHDNITVQMARVVEVTKGHPTPAQGPAGQATPAHGQGGGTPYPGAATPGPSQAQGWGQQPPHEEAATEIMGRQASRAPAGPSQQFAAPPNPAQQPQLGGYRMEAGGLPLPPPSGYSRNNRPQTGSMQQMQQPPAQTPYPPSAQQTPYPPSAQTPPPNSGFAPMPIGEQRPTRGGVFYAIIGMSAIIAVLLILVLVLALR